MTQQELRAAKAMVSAYDTLRGIRYRTQERVKQGDQRTEQQMDMHFLDSSIIAREADEAMTTLQSGVFALIRDATDSTR